MNQTRMESLVEAIVNVLIGFGIGFLSQIVIFRAYGYQVTMAENLAMTCWFTAISIARSYCIRRWFNTGIRNGIHRFVTAFRRALGEK
jgi:hypothetical protein